MAIQTATSGLETGATDSEADRLIRKSTEEGIFVSYLLVNVGVVYDLPMGVTGAKLGRPTAKKSDGAYKVPVIWANGNGTDEMFEKYGLGKRPYGAVRFKVVPNPGSPTGHRLLYLSK